LITFDREVVMRLSLYYKGCKFTFERGNVVLGDAFFATYFFITAMLDNGVDLVMEQLGTRRRSTDFRKGKELGTKDHLIILTKPKKRPDWMDETHGNRSRSKNYHKRG
jgi:hypothetical protein